MTDHATIQQTPALAADVLKNLDFIILADKSGSMGEPSNRYPGKTRWEEMQETLTSIARQAGQHDDDGLTVVLFSGSHKTVDGITADKTKELFSQNHPGGGTNLVPALTAAVDKARASEKQAAVLVFTDGEAADGAAAIKYLNQIGTELGRKKVGFAFVQVGTDQAATDFLKNLDDALTVDVVATVSEEEAEDLTLGQLAYLALNA